MSSGASDSALNVGKNRSINSNDKKARGKLNFLRIPISTKKGNHSFLRCVCDLKIAANETFHVFMFLALKLYFINDIPTMYVQSRFN